MFKPLVVIPHYNHSLLIGDVLSALTAQGLDVLVVDDGSSAEHRTTLAMLANQFPHVTLRYLPENRGKGGAMKAGFQFAIELGASHILQIDADGQHHFADIPRFLAKSQQNPTALICGNPVYGDDVPKARLYGRKITNFWIAVNTFSNTILDGMCGFRVYPVSALLSIIQQEKIGERMDFDTEILVHCQWRKMPMIWLDTPVKYEANGVSHFRMWKDNWLISKMHARLFFKHLYRRFTGKI